MYATAFLDLPPLDSASGTVTLPGSKSISNRVLLLSALCSGTTVVQDLLDSDDTRVMLDALRQLGCGVEVQGTTVTIEGLGGALKHHNPIEFFMGNAGTAMRPLTAALAVMGGNFTLKGVPRMHERPIGDLVDALRLLGCTIDYLGQTHAESNGVEFSRVTRWRPSRLKGHLACNLQALGWLLRFVGRHAYGHHQTAK